MAEDNKTSVQYWAKWTDEDGEEHFEKVAEINDDTETFTFSLDEVDEDEAAEPALAEVKALCGKTLREKFYLLGMCQAYENVLGIADEDEDE